MGGEKKWYILGLKQEQGLLAKELISEWPCLNMKEFNENMLEKEAAACFESKASDTKMYYQGGLKHCHPSQGKVRERNAETDCKGWERQRKSLQNTVLIPDRKDTGVIQCTYPLRQNVMHNPQENTQQAPLTPSHSTLPEQARSVRSPAVATRSATIGVSWRYYYSILSCLWTLQR